MRCSVALAALVMILPNPVRVGPAAAPVCYRRPSPLRVRGLVSHVVIVGVDDDAGADGGQPVLSELSVVMADSTGVGSGPGVRGPPAP